MRWEVFDSVDYHVMQYTGLKDINGKEIYDDDILEFNKEQRGEVQFARGAFGCSASHLWEINDGEVVGNIYEDEHT